MNKKLLIATWVVVLWYSFIINFSSSIESAWALELITFFTIVVCIITVITGGMFFLTFIRRLHRKKYTLRKVASKTIKYSLFAFSITGLLLGVGLGIMKSKIPFKEKAIEKSPPSLKEPIKQKLKLIKS